MKAVTFLMIVLLFVVMPATGATVTFVSGDGSATSSTGNVYNITPHPAWDTIPAANWVSGYQNTGLNGTVLPNWSGGAPTMTFTQQFFLPGSVNTGSAIFGADDTMAVWLNGTLLKPANFTMDGACADGPIACEPGEFMNLLLTPYLIPGMNTLTMEVYQLGGGPTGAIWSGRVESVPEPSTVALMGLGLLGLGLVRNKYARKG